MSPARKKTKSIGRSLMSRPATAAPTTEQQPDSGLDALAPPPTTRDLDCCRFGDCEPVPAEGVIYHLDGSGDYHVEVVDAQKFREAHGDLTPQQVAAAHTSAMHDYWREVAAEYRAETDADE